MIERWVHPIGLHLWDITFLWSRETPDDAVMRCEAHWEYLCATITVYLPRVQEYTNDARLEVIFVHELMHIFLKEARWADEARELSMEHEEHVATLLAKAFVWVRDAAQRGEAPALPLETKHDE